MRLTCKVCLMLMALLTVSCENYIRYHSYRNLDAAGWKKSDTLTLTLNMADTLVRNHEVAVLVRNRTDYRFQNLMLEVSHNYPDTLVWKTDTLTFEIADENANWLGEGIGGLYETTAPLTEGDALSRQAYTFRITSLMTDPVLNGINDIGVVSRRK